MKTFAILLTTLLLSLFLSVAAFAKGPPTLIINGGGIAINNNSGGGELLSIGKVTAQIKGGNTYGKVKARSVLAADPTITVAGMTGKVVCIMELPDSVWEVRFEVVKAFGAAAALEGLYGSTFVFDGGNPGAGNDFIDENFSPPYTDECGLRVEGVDFELEDVIAGNFKVKQR